MPLCPLTLTPCVGAAVSTCAQSDRPLRRQLIRTDLISAMKLADSEYLSPDEYLEIADQWKQEWERGVQVPVNPDTLPHPRVSCVPGPPQRLHDFKL